MCAPSRNFISRLRIDITGHDKDIVLENIIIDSFGSLKNILGLRSIKQFKFFVFLVDAFMYKSITEENMNPFFEAVAVAAVKNCEVIVKIQKGTTPPNGSPSKGPESIVVMEAPLPSNSLLEKLKFIDASNLAVVYDDPTVTMLIEYIEAATLDSPALLLMAPPGAGKSFTVERACKELSWYRKKFEEIDKTEINGLLMGASVAGGMSYDECMVICKSRVEKKFNSCFTPILESAAAAFCNGDENTRFVVHFDEAQVLMSSNVVHREDVMVSQVLYDYVFLTFCNMVASSISGADSRIRVIISGTNFFAPLCLNVGSQLKHVNVGISGTFPLEWLFKEVIVPQFQHYVFEDLKLHEAEICERLYDVSFNRRVSHNTLFFMQTYLAQKGRVEAIEFLRLITSKADEAYQVWRKNITKFLRGGVCCVAVAQALALLLFPSQHGGVMVGDMMQFPRQYISEQIIACALGGAFYCEIDDNYVCFRPPRGIVMRFLLLQGAAITRENFAALAAFHEVSRTVPTVKGHWLERALCCELSFHDSPLHRIIALKTKRDLVFNSHLAAKGFQHSARIHLESVEALSGHIFCVEEDPVFKDERIVDVGYSLYDTKQQRYVKVLFECKDVASATETVKMAHGFLGNSVLARDKDSILVFLSRQPFMDHSPQSRATTKPNAINAVTAKALVDEILCSNPHNRVVLEGHELANTRLFSQIGTHADVATLSTTVESLYIHNSTEKCTGKNISLWSQPYSCPSAQLGEATMGTFETMPHAAGGASSSDPCETIFSVANKQPPSNKTFDVSFK